MIYKRRLFFIRKKKLHRHKCLIVWYVKTKSKNNYLNL